MTEKKTQVETFTEFYQGFKANAKKVEETHWVTKIRDKIADITRKGRDPIAILANETVSAAVQNEMEINLVHVMHLQPKNPAQKWHNQETLKQVLDLMFGLPFFEVANLPDFQVIDNRKWFET